MNERPELNKELDTVTFHSFYYLKQELIDFCRENRLPTLGSKTELADRIAHFLDTGNVLKSSASRKAAEASTYVDGYSAEQRTEIICAVKEQLPPDEVQAVHYADVLLQNIELGKYINDSAELNEHRDRMMAENVLWILQQEQSRGSSRIIISGHNNHIMQCQNAGAPVLGSLLAEKLGDGYFAIGTDFYKSVCNLPKPYTGERITHTFYSHNPLAKASKQCSFAVSFLDFSKVPGDSPLAEYISSSIPMGSLGESYSILMNFIPRSYRVSRTPQEAYDAMIFVADATPIEIKSLKK